MRDREPSHKDDTIDKLEKGAEKRLEVDPKQFVTIPLDVFQAIGNYMGNRPWKEVDGIVSAIRSVPTLEKFLEQNDLK